jgi:hypothetical protein
MHSFPNRTRLPFHLHLSHRDIKASRKSRAGVFLKDFSGKIALIIEEKKEA